MNNGVDRRKMERLGETNTNKYGSKMTIVEYNHARDIVVEFESGNKVRTEYKHFKNKSVKSVYDKSVYSIGYIGEGYYKIRENGIVTRRYETWKGMLERCYDSKLHMKFPLYIGCTVVEEWHNFQNFAKWYDDNYYGIEGHQMNLDKDILVKGNKIYSPNTCVFVPKFINNLFTNRKNGRGTYPVGVSFNLASGKYVAQCNSTNGTRTGLGYFHTADEAFDAYKIYKEKTVREIADIYKNIIPVNLYNAMKSYTVDVND